MSLSILIAAGGTGGHMVPAHALSEELRRRGHRVTLLTDSRGLRFPGLFESVDRHVLESATATGFNPVAWSKAAVSIWKGREAGRRIARAVSAQAVIGFGGYPSLPGVLAGISLGLPSLIHEQNAVLGRVNRRLQHRVSAIALTYPETRNLSPAGESRVTVTGNPVRESVLAARDIPYMAPAAGQPLNLLVIGGSQGARILSQRVPEAVALLSDADRQRLRVVQQCRNEDLSAVVTAYQAAGVAHECHSYMEDLPVRLAMAHLVISRAGASTMAELMAIGRPAILIPFAAATDDHQTANSAGFVNANAGLMVAESALTASGLSGMIRGFVNAPEALAAAAAAARNLGVPDAAGRLADLIEQQTRDLATASRSGADS